MAVTYANDFTLNSEFNELYSFPCLPKEIQISPLATYFNNLKIGEVFAYNDQSSKLVIRKFAKTKNHDSILVMSEREGCLCEKEGYMPWVIIEIDFENSKFKHTKLGAYFEEDDGTRAFFKEQLK